MNKNPYRELTEAEREERHAKAEAAKQRQIDTIEAAQKCLATEEFKRYKEGYDKTAGQLLEQICLYDNPDPIQYAFAMRDMIGRLKVLRFLINKVEGDANRKVKDATS